MVQNIEKVLDSEIEKAKYREWFDSLAFNRFSGNNENSQISSAQLESQRDELLKEFNELSKVYSNNNNMQERADALMEQYRFAQFVQLLATYGQMVHGYRQLCKKTKDLDWAKKKLETIDQIYIEPVVEELKKSQTYNMEKIKNGLDQLELLSEYIERGIIDIKGQTFTHGINAVVNSIDAMTSVSKITSLWDYASSIQLAIQGAMAFFQVTAAAGSVYLTVWSAYSWSNWQDLKEELQKRSIALKQLNKELQIKHN